MSKEVKEANAEAKTESVVKTNITEDDFIARRTGQNTGETPAADVQENSEPTDDPSLEGEGEEESNDDVLSKFNLDDYSAEEIKELSKKLGSRAVDRFGELTARAKGAEEELAKLRDSVDPLATEPDPEDNPFSELNTLVELKEKAAEIDSIIEWAEDLMDESSDFGMTDSVGEVEGKPITKAELKTTLKNARKSRKTYLPAQYQQLQAQSQLAQSRQEFGRKALDEFEWLKGTDENDERRKEFIKIAGSKKMKEAFNASPELPYFLAHAVDNMYGRKTIDTDAPAKKQVETKQKRGSSPSLTPNKAPSASTAQPGVTERKPVKKIAELNARFHKSGKASDFVNFRTQQFKTK